jgi:hypothetical protein
MTLLTDCRSHPRPPRPREVTNLNLTPLVLYYLTPLTPLTPLAPLTPLNSNYPCLIHIMDPDKAEAFICLRISHG